MTKLKIWIFQWLYFKFYNYDGSAKRCTECGSNHIHEHVKCVDANVVSEYEEICSICGYSCAYYAYGFYEPHFRERGTWKSVFKLLRHCWD